MVEEFVTGIGRAWAIVSTPREISEATTTRWLEQQVAPGLSAIHDLHPDTFLKDLITSGRYKRKRIKKYDLLLSVKEDKND